MLNFEKRQWAFVCLVALALAPFVAPLRGRAQATGYTVTDLGTLGGAQSVAFAVSACGQVAGESQFDSSTHLHPFRWDGAMQDLGTLGGLQGTAVAVNDLGHVAGSADTAPLNNRRPFLWTPAAGKVELPTLGGLSAIAFDLNNANQIVGESEVAGPVGAIFSRAFIWDSAGGIRAINTLGGTSNGARGTNDAGHVVGYSETDGGTTHAFLLAGETLTDLGVLGTGTRSVAHEVNDSGDVAGFSWISPFTTANVPFHAFIWSASTGMLDLGTLGGNFSVAHDVNNAGQTVGWSEVAPGQRRAFIYTRTGGMLDLNDLAPGTGWTFSEARAINDSGQIVGFGTNPDGALRAFLLTPDGVTPPPCPTPTSTPTPTPSPTPSPTPTPSSTPTPSPTPLSLTTPVGTNVHVQGDGVSITFPQVSVAGGTTVAPLEPLGAGVIPPGYAINASSIAFEITSTAAFTPPVDVCFNLPTVNDEFTFLNLRVLYAENGVLVDRTLSRDFPSRRICIRAAALGPFLIAQATANPIDSSDLFVAQHYRDFLGREPDPGGLVFWKNQTTNCGNPDPLVCRINVSAAFFLSIEFQETGFFVYRLYKAAYGDAASPGVARTVPIIRRHEFLPDSQRVAQGVVVGVGDWPQQLEANRRAFALEFVRRQRFADAYPASLTPAQFVAALDQRAGGALSEAERDQLVAELTADNTETGRASVLRKVADDEDLRRTEFNRAFVLMQYYGYLLRNPDDAPDTNFGGWAFWLSKLEEFNGNFIGAEMVRAFLDSIEYRQRFAR